MIQSYDSVLYLYCKILSCFSFFFLLFYYYQLLYNIAALVANKVPYIKLRCYQTDHKAIIRQADQMLLSVKQILCWETQASRS